MSIVRKKYMFLFKIVMFSINVFIKDVIGLLILS